MAAEERIMLGLSLTALVEDHREWSDTTLGTPAERGPIGALKHLQKEAVEAEGAARTLKEQAAQPWWADSVESDSAIANAKENYIARLTSDFRSELADCLLLLLDANRRAGFSILEMVEAAQAKMIVNRTRTYPKPTSDVPSEHVREPELGGES